MATPRKFSEKIALHNQKQAEETRRFEQIMREVSDVTTKVIAHPKQHLRINPSLGSFRGGSLPNVNHVANNAIETKTDLPNAVSNLEELNNSRTDVSVVRERGRQPGVGPMRGRAIEKRIDTSPYGGVYLSPPDTSWRRTNSDSALHQSAMCGQEVCGPRRSHHDNQLMAFSLHDKTEQRPRSSCYDGPLVPGISICPSPHDPGAVPIPIGNNTGSLPDLTSFQNFHFPSPLPTPLDQEDHNSSFSTSPQGASPSTLSPTSLASSRPTGRFPFGGSSPQESRVPSPHGMGHSPVQRRRAYPQTHLQNLVIGPHSPTQTSPLQNHLGVPSFRSSSYLHQSKGVTQDHSVSVSVPANMDGYSPKFIYHNSPVSPPLTNCSLSPQPEGGTGQQQQQQQQQMTSLNSYRNSQSNRPSPQNSPGLAVQQVRLNAQVENHMASFHSYRTDRPSPQSSPGLQVNHHYRSASPGDHSAPQSPVSPAGSPGTNAFPETTFYLSEAQTAAALQHHFEQINMTDAPTTASIRYITLPQNSTTTSTQGMSPDDPGAVVLKTEAEYYSSSPSQLQFTKPAAGSGSTQQTTPQTPNTPSSIPDIILTDFSSAAVDELAKHEFAKDEYVKHDFSKDEFVKDIEPMTGSFDSDLFPVDDTLTLRESLGQIDFDGFQMLTDPDMTVTDPLTESNFRYDRLDAL